LRNKLVALAVSGLGVVAFAVMPSAHAASSQSYVAGTGDIASLNCDGSDAAAAPGIGGACFAATPGATITVTVTDQVASDTAAEVYSEDAAGNLLDDAPTAVCGTGTYTVLPGAARVLVFIDTAFAPLDCGPGQNAGTTGTITVS
jgi:hypothetical protein